LVSLVSWLFHVSMAFGIALNFCRRHCHKSISVQHSIYLRSRQRHVAKQHTHRLYCCVSTATMITRTLHNVTLYVHCLFYDALVTFKCILVAIK
jgi:hypothetical protein